MTSHITVVDVQGSRRIMGPQPRRHNLCGADLTDKDWLRADARRATADELEAFNVCDECLRIMGLGR